MSLLYVHAQFTVLVGVTTPAVGDAKTFFKMGSRIVRCQCRPFRENVSCTSRRPPLYLCHGREREVHVLQ